MNDITVYQIGKTIWQLCDRKGCRCHLIEGSRCALLVDTMCGDGDLYRVVRSITNLPVHVVLTHGHFDHIGGIYGFDHVYLPEMERENIRVGMVHLARLRQEMFPDNVKGARTPTASMLPEFITVKPGDHFDLGGEYIHAVPLPGHTAGSMGYLCKESRILFSGDAVTPIMCLFFSDSMSIGVYRNTLEYMKQLPFEVFYTSHHARRFEKDEIDEFDACAAFSLNEPGMYYQHDLLPEYRGRLHVYRGDNSEADDFLAIISPYVPRNRKK